MIRAGRVTVNGKVAELGASADPELDAIELDGRPLRSEPSRYWMLNKPKGVITTVSDERGRKTVMDLLPPSGSRLFPVGRLDRDTEGLLLLTNDGDVAQALLHPSLESPRVYRVTVAGELGPEAAEQLAQGVEIEAGVVTSPARVGPRRYDSERETTTFTLSLIEGRKRQIRRSMEVLGHPVRRLVRTRMGPIELGRLPRGRARELTPSERKRLLGWCRRTPRNG